MTMKLNFSASHLLTFILSVQTNVTKNVTQQPSDTACDLLNKNQINSLTAVNTLSMQHCTHLLLDIYNRTTPFAKPLESNDTI